MSKPKDMMASLAAMRDRLSRIDSEIYSARSLPERRESVLEKLRPNPAKIESYHLDGFNVEDLESVVDRTMSEMIGFEICEANKARRRELLRIAREVDDIRDGFPDMLIEISRGLAELSRQLQKEGKE